MKISPKSGRIAHALAMTFWAAQMVTVVFIIGGWRLYLLEISLWANFASHWAGLSAERPSETIES
jgi:hypothetical protein